MAVFTVRPKPRSLRAFGYGNAHYRTGVAYLSLCIPLFAFPGRHSETHAKAVSQEDEKKKESFHGTVSSTAIQRYD